MSQQLVENGWEKEDAEEFVGSIATQMAAARTRQKASGGGGTSWLIWIGLLLLINLLSYIFNWPFWIY